MATAMVTQIASLDLLRDSGGACFNSNPLRKGLVYSVVNIYTFAVCFSLKLGQYYKSKALIYHGCKG
eukprot:4317979-Amphidinium_carterae.1